MATQRRHWAFAILGSCATLAAVTVGLRVHHVLTMSTNPGRETLEILGSSALFLCTFGLVYRLGARRRPGEGFDLPAEFLATLDAMANDLNAVRSDVDAMARDICRLDENLEIVAGRTSRIANHLEHEVAVTDGESTGEVVRLPKHRGSGSRIS